MTKLRQVVTPILLAIALSGIQLWAGIRFSTQILWQVTLMHNLVGPGPILGYDVHGQPMYEGTPVQMVAAFAGLGIGVVVYWLIFRFTLRKLKWHDHGMRQIGNRAASR